MQNTMIHLTVGREVKSQSEGFGLICSGVNMLCVVFYVLACTARVDSVEQ